MKKNSLQVKLVVGVFVIGTIFLGGSFAAQALAERSASDLMEKNEAPVNIERDMAETEELSVYDYHVKLVEEPEKILEKFEEKFNIDPKKMTMAEVSKEQFDYLYAWGMIYGEGESPILTKNEQKDNLEDGRALQTSLADVMAMSSDIDSEGPIIEICEKYSVDPEGQIKDLSPEIIIEISNKFYEISDHPKE